MVVRSSAKVEYRAIAQGVCEVSWLEKLIKDLNMPISTFISLYSDSKLAKNIVNNLIQHDWMKNVRTDRHFVKQETEDKSIKLTYIPIES